jgi:hypothetical protein
VKLNLDGLKTEIERYLEESGMGVFYGHARTLESLSVVYWDCAQHPDYKLFIQAARSAGAKLIVYHQSEFSSHQIDDALEQLTTCDLPREEHLDFEQRLKEIRVYDGLVSSIELSFDHGGSVFVFDLRTEWYEELTDIVDEIQVFTAEPDDNNDTPIGGYFSRN